MKIAQSQWKAGSEWSVWSGDVSAEANLVLVFGDRKLLEAQAGWYHSLRSQFPKADIVSCSTAGEIIDTRVQDGSIVATAVTLGQSRILSAASTLDAAAGSYATGMALAKALDAPDLRLVFVLCDGLMGNGTALSNGLNDGFGRAVAVTGGLAGDGPDFAHTLTGLNALPTGGQAVAIGFYGDSLKVGHGCRGGWDEFGPERLVTASEGNVLKELDHESALGLYKRYLGEYSNGLPATGLLFPIHLRIPGGQSLVRTLLAVDEEKQTMTFAGDLPQGATVKLMRANFDRVIDAAEDAAAESLDSLQGQKPQLALLVSCVGRKFVLGQRVDEEVENARLAFGPQAALTGFYSYGELSPIGSGNRCELHNQTMTVTTLSED